MSASLTLTGVSQLAAEIKAAGEEFTRTELAPIVRGAADGLAGEVKAAYPKQTGNLADGVVVENGRDGRGLRAKVRTNAPHAHLYELGTVQRFTNRTGASRGTMPARPTFVPLAIRWRERMIDRTKDALQRLKIRGFDGAAGVRQS